ncbi:Hint domain-containing protein [Primorskyibacter sp. S87]|uniref:Hint domain-containing protein n=1 Tax=Primorskyibacter sp. S87 TaxID=3415126 RepID=UPI003C7B655A
MKPNTVGRVERREASAHPPAHPDSLLGATPHSFDDTSQDVGLSWDTILLTAEGEQPVQMISPGDRIITRDSGFVRLTGMRSIRVMTRAIYFTAGSLGDTRPDCDLILPAGQQVLIRDWRARALFGQSEALVRADALPDKEFVRDLGEMEMELFQPEFEAPHVIYAGGLELGCPGTQQHLRPAA